MDTELINNSILLKLPKSHKFRIDICEPNSLLNEWKTHEEYYQSYFDINHGSFFVVKINKVTHELYLFDPEYHYLVSYNMTNGKPEQVMRINDDNNLYIVPSYLSSKCLNCNRIAYQHSNGYCNLRNCQKISNEINLPFDRLITLNEFYDLDIAKNFIPYHTECFLCQDKVHFNIVWFMSLNFNDINDTDNDIYRYNLLVTQLIDEYNNNKDRQVHIFPVLAGILATTRGYKLLLHNHKLNKMIDSKFKKWIKYINSSNKLKKKYSSILNDLLLFKSDLEDVLIK